MNPINPFDLPGNWGPNVPLSPCDISEHHDYYVSLGNTEELFGEFSSAMRNPVTLTNRGQLVLVTGESGCGKSALVNHCAYHLREELGQVEVVDLRTSLHGLPAQTMDQRLSRVAALLVAKLSRAGVLRPGAGKDLAGFRDYPEEIYLMLPDALVERQYVVVLLPASELVNEVVRYAAMACARVLFMIEHALLDDEEDIRAMQRWAPPVLLRVAGLKHGDVARYAKDRLQRHANVGIFPRMSERTLESAAQRLRTAAQMQSTFHGTYAARLRDGRRYDSKSYVTAGEIDAYLLSGLQDGQGGRS